MKLTKTPTEVVWEYAVELLGILSDFQQDDEWVGPLDLSEANSLIVRILLLSAPDEHRRVRRATRAPQGPALTGHEIPLVFGA